MPMDPKTNTQTFFTAPGTFNYCAFEVTFIPCYAPAPHFWKHLTYDQVLKSGSCHFSSESFFADEDINLYYKHFNNEPEVESDHETVLISNISHVGVAEMINVL